MKTHVKALENGLENLENRDSEGTSAAIDVAIACMQLRALRWACQFK